MNPNYAVRVKEEINKFLEEYDDQQITIAIELATYEKECRRWEGEHEEKIDTEPAEEGFDQTVRINKSH